MALQAEVRTIDPRHVTLGTFQLRECLDAEAVERYAQAMDAGAALPPIVCWCDDDAIVHVVDGEHRAKAAVQLATEGRLRDGVILCQWLDGDACEAWEYAIRANSSNGLPYTPAERDKAIKRLHDERPEMTTREIGAIVGASKSTVARVLAPPKPAAPAEAKTPKPDAMAAEIKLPPKAAEKRNSFDEETACAVCGKTYRLSEIIELEGADVRWNGYKVAWLACCDECSEKARERAQERAADAILDQGAKESKEAPETPRERIQAAADRKRDGVAEFGDVLLSCDLDLRDLEAGLDFFRGKEKERLDKTTVDVLERLRDKMWKITDKIALAVHEWRGKN